MSLQIDIKIESFDSRNPSLYSNNPFILLVSLIVDPDTLRITLMYKKVDTRNNSMVKCVK
jgi:hypothetical protein